MSGLLEIVLKKFLAGEAPTIVQSRMEKAIPKIVAGMEAKGVTPQEASGTIVVRDALFRLWRSVIPSGDIADLVRDSQDDKVLVIVGPVTSAMTTEAVVRKTLAALLEVTF